ncbi:MAG: cytochrome C, partial [Chloroflexota bacterium]|nr:cytochrome C [Chloroflexota bacterium]
MAVTRRELLTGGAAGAAGLIVGGVIGRTVGGGGEGGGGAGLTADVQQIADSRGLSAEDVRKAVKTFVPPGKPQLDEFLMFASGGHGGQILVIGVPSMRLYKVIG